MNAAATQVTSPPTGGRLLDTADLAVLFNVTPTAIRRWTRLGLIPKPNFMTGRIRRWKPEAIHSFLDSQQGRAVAQ